MAKRAHDVVAEMATSCLLLRTRMLARVVTAVYDDELRPFGVGSPQFALLVIIARMQPATRAGIGRRHRQERSTLTRNLKAMLDAGWVEEVETETGRGRPLVVTKEGRNLLRCATPAWRAAQEKAKSILGKRGVAAVTDVANGWLAT